MSLRIAVLRGGRSSEHDVSMASAQAVIAALEAGPHDAIPVTIDRESGLWRRDGQTVQLAPNDNGTPELRAGTDAEPIDLVFPVLHGPFGEDGTVQGACETAGAPYVGAGVAASAVAMDKGMFKVFMNDIGLDTAKHELVTHAEWRRDPTRVAERVGGSIGYPAFSKPARLGSSVGISRVADADGLTEALDLAFAHDSRVLVETAISGREVEVGVLGNDELEVSPVGEISYASEWYDYSTKYEPDQMSLEVPADIPEESEERARHAAAAAFKAIDCAGMARVDFFLEPSGRVLISELNTIPGFTPTSVYARLMEAGGLDYDELIERLVQLGIERAEAASGYRC
jgi:D-alanine-D-alanine ligase